MGTVIYCREILKKKGFFTANNNTSQSPRGEIKLAAQSLAVATKLAEQLGLTPKARQAMGISILPAATNEDKARENTKARFFGR
jgi:phage terminase small subunit